MPHNIERGDMARLTVPLRKQHAMSPRRTSHPGNHDLGRGAIVEVVSVNETSARIRSGAMFRTVAVEHLEPITETDTEGV